MRSEDPLLLLSSHVLTRGSYSREDGESGHEGTIVGLSRTSAPKKYGRIHSSVLFVEPGQIRISSRSKIFLQHSWTTQISKRVPLNLNLSWKTLTVL